MTLQAFGPESMITMPAVGREQPGIPKVTNVHRMTYANGAFGEEVRKDWDRDTSPAWPLLAAINRTTLLSYFEHDDPPIPPEIRQRYEQEAAGHPYITVEQIDGVGHNFRDPVAPYATATTDEVSMIGASARIVQFLQANEPKSTP
jgi:pimeloyl-ACP methyl ester carboxylesterase